MNLKLIPFETPAQQEFVDLVLGTTRRQFEAAHEVTPRLIVDGRPRGIAVTNVSTATAGEKDALGLWISTLRRTFPCVAFVVEAWVRHVVRSSAEDVKPEDMDPRVSRHPDRIEVLMATIYCGTGRTVAFSAKILRAAGSPAALAEWEVLMDNALEGSTIDGRLAGGETRKG